MNSDDYCECLSEGVCQCSDKKKVRRYLEFDFGYNKYYETQVCEFIAPLKAYVNPNTTFVLKLSDISIERLSVLICRILSEIECLAFECKDIPLKKIGFSHDAFAIEMEYGTLPKVQTLTPHQRRLYDEFKHLTLLDVVDKALQKFPHNQEVVEDEEGEEIIHMLGMGIRGWCKSSISISFDTFNPTVVIVELIRHTGDRWTHRWIYEYLFERLNQELPTDATTDLPKHINDLHLYIWGRTYSYRRRNFFEHELGYIPGGHN